MKQPKVVVPLALLALAGGATAATATGPPRAASSGTTRHLTASRTRLRFTASTMHVRHGTVTIVMSNPSHQGHSIGVDGHGIDKEGKYARPGRTSSVTVRLNRGHYTFYCPVDDHRAEGMRGTIFVS